MIGLKVALADGTIVTTGGTAPRAAVGPDLNQLFVGSEGTLGIVTEARLRLHPVAPAEGRRAWGFADFAQGLDAAVGSCVAAPLLPCSGSMTTIESERNFSGRYRTPS